MSATKTPVIVRAFPAIADGSEATPEVVKLLRAAGERRLPWAWEQER